MRASYKLGVDIGSTTQKVALFDENGRLAFAKYERHHGYIVDTLLKTLGEVFAKFGDVKASFSITGSAGMGISEKFGYPFAQELVATSFYVETRYPEVRTIIDIGGEDSKIIFLENGRRDMTMNGSCAGGTGSFIDQIASLLDVSLEEMEKLASEAKRFYPIASRCGVFAKTDAQNLLSKKADIRDVALSTFRAVALQIKNSLLRGREIRPKVLFTGGPFAFLPTLKKTAKQIFDLSDGDAIEVEYPQNLAAFGAALLPNPKAKTSFLSQILEKLSEKEKRISISETVKEPLFKDEKDFFEWKARKEKYKTERISLEKLDGKKAFLGIDSGSTTTKIALIDEQNRLAFSYYANNKGDPVEAVVAGLKKLENELAAKKTNVKIQGSAATGYGEELIRSAFGLDFGTVETIAHFLAAQTFEPDVSFILDIGGQDMKAVYIENGTVKNIELNEACSSGCGSFIETFANSMNLSVQKFAEIAVLAKSPRDLGSRCTVFMNSKVKQAFRENAPVEDISAGLSYSVVENCLRKVLKIYDPSVLGDKILLQGGAFKSAATFRAFEKTLGKEAAATDIPELMGAFGAALYAKEKSASISDFKPSFKFLANRSIEYQTKKFRCRGCQNNCEITKLIFDNGQVYYAGNRCERFFSNSGSPKEAGFNFARYKYELLFDRPAKIVEKPKARIGIPRILNFYENYPFWNSLFVNCGFEVVLSDDSDEKIFELGAGSVMSDNICFPAKLSHGHIINLIQKKVDRIFYPLINFEIDEIDEESNSFNCPIVAGYANVIRSAVDPEGKYGVPFDTPNVNFKNKAFLKKAAFKYFKSLGTDKKTFDKAFSLALKELEKFKQTLKTKAVEVLTSAALENRKIAVLGTRPYQIDPFVNRGIPDIIAGYGWDVLLENPLPFDKSDSLGDLNVLSQWAYPNRLYRAAKWSSKYDDVEFIQINSFGCGPDVVVIDEIKDLLEEKGKIHSVIRVDEHSALGSLKLRIRSLIESINLRDSRGKTSRVRKKRLVTRAFLESDRDRTILAPFFSPFHTAYVSAAFKNLGYNVVELPPSDNESIELGLKFVNNEICYPAILVIGDVLRALKSEEFKNKKLAVAITQTGGQCRASNYVPLLKKALAKNGYDDVPVIGLTLSSANLNYQPGFKIDKFKFIKIALMGLLFGDGLSRMYYSTAPREKIRGTAKKLSERFIREAQEPIANADKKGILAVLEKAVEAFNKVEIAVENPPRVGIVGEIYVKYNPAGNAYIVDRLTEERVEPVFPPLINMFVQWFVNIRVKNEFLIEKKPIMKIFGAAAQKFYESIDAEFERVLVKFRYYRKKKSLETLARNAEKVINLSAHYFGEGWLIPADILDFAEDGVKKVICLQPFGCIANQIVARGVEKTIRAVDPEIQTLYLDIDAGVSPVNITNRLKLLLADYPDKRESEEEREPEEAKIEKKTAENGFF